MIIKKSNLQRAKKITFLIVAVPLAYTSIASRFEVALLAMLALGMLYLWLKPFSATIKDVSIVLVIYLAGASFLGLIQPLYNDTWSLFSLIIVLSTILQPFIFLLTLDGIIGLLRQTKTMSDIAVVVLFWLATFAGVFGSITLTRVTESDPQPTFLIFLVPWFVNGVVFFVASIMITLMFSKGVFKKIEQQPKTKKTKDAK